MTSAELTGTTLIVGPGWLGAPLAEHIVQLGSRCFTLQRSAVSANATSVDTHVVPLVGDIASVAQNEHALSDVVPLHIDRLVVCIAPSRVRGDDYSVYPRAAAGAATLARTMRIRHVLYVSSTGVYDRHDGSEVTESSSITPRDARVQALYDAERAFEGLNESTVHILRAAGLYGPQRDPAARLIDPALGSSNVWCNFAWRDDVISAITHLLQHDTAVGVRTFNCADSTPLLSGEITARLTGEPVTDAVATQVPIATAVPVRSGRSNQRINVDALLATGWHPSAPSVYDGLRLLGHSLPFA